MNEIDELKKEFRLLAKTNSDLTAAVKMINEGIMKMNFCFQDLLTHLKQKPEDYEQISIYR